LSRKEHFVKCTSAPSVLTADPPAPPATEFCENSQSVSRAVELVTVTAPPASVVVNILFPTKETLLTSMFELLTISSAAGASALPLPLEKSKSLMLPALTLRKCSKGVLPSPSSAKRSPAADVNVMLARQDITTVDATTMVSFSSMVSPSCNALAASRSSSKVFTVWTTAVAQASRVQIGMRLGKPIHRPTNNHVKGICF